jgi:hypothetical protein
LRSPPRKRKLETESGLELYNSSRQTIGCVPELASVVAGRPVIDDIGLCGCGYQWSQVQDIEDVEEVCPNFQLGSFSKEPLLRQGERLAERHIYREVARAGKDVAAAAART